MEAEAAALSHLQLQLLALVSDLRLTRDELCRGGRRRRRSAGGRLRSCEQSAAQDDALQRLESRDSACSLQWTIQMRDKQITVISEKLNSHLALFNSVGKEVAAVKQVLGDVECLVGEKENVVSDLKCKVQRISVLEKDFDEIIERLISDKQEMLKELHNMETALQKFQDIFSRLGHEEMKSSLPVSESQDCKRNSIPGSQVDLPNEDRMIPIIDETANANAECKPGIDTGSNQVQSPPSLKHYALPCSEPVAANIEKPECPPESEDIEMGTSPEQQTHSANPDPEIENQS
ncbi:hypothetical protein ZWY2020_048872 [Hordeum vulgare]|nr:hypothetical protein ZWY2020_048872 [Hordeum vulgare]